jgi:hypothetical protein
MNLNMNCFFIFGVLFLNDGFQLFYNIKQSFFHHLKVLYSLILSYFVKRNLKKHVLL